MAGEAGIEALLGTAMDRLGAMVSINTVVGQPIAADGTTIIPISRVSLGFMAGGGEYATKAANPAFGGGSGGGMSVTPLGFLVCCDGAVRYVPVAGQAPLDKLLDMAPGLIDCLSAGVGGNKCTEKCAENKHKN